MKDSEGREDRDSTSSLSSWLSDPKPTARSFFRFFHAGTETQGSGPPSTSIPVYKQGLRLELEQPRHMPIWDATPCRQRLSLLYHSVGRLFIYLKPELDNLSSTDHSQNGHNGPLLDQAVATINLEFFLILSHG